MKTNILFALLLLPGLAQAVICKTVGADGVVSFTDVPAAECPQGSRVTDYARPALPAERVEQVDTGITGREVDFAGYRSIAIVSPEDGGIVRTNEGRVSVKVDLDPALLQSHFITVTLDGKPFRGRYGSSAVELTGVDPGEHKLRARVIDAKGKTLIDSKTVSFTLLRAQPIRVGQVAPHPTKPGTYIVAGRFLGGPLAKPEAAGAEVTIRFPGSKKEYKGMVDNFLNWTVEVGSEPAVELQFDVKVEILDLEFNKTQDINPTISRPTFTPPPPEGYAPVGPADYTPNGGGISTTPGQTNPAFKPSYTP